MGGGHNDWCVIACFSDAEWQTLVDLMGRPGWATDAKFGSLSGRLQHQEELDEGIERWTHTIDKYEHGEVPGRWGVRCRCKAPRTGSSATPTQSPRHVPRVGPSAAWTTQGPDVPFKHSKTPAVVHRPARSSANTPEKSCKSTRLSLDDIRGDTPTAPSGPRTCRCLTISRRRCDDRCCRCGQRLVALQGH